MTDHNRPFAAFIISVVRLFWETSNRVLARCHRQALPLQLIHKCLWGCITNPVTPEVWWEGLPRFSWDCLLAHWTLSPRDSRVGFIQATWERETRHPCLCWAGKLYTLRSRKMIWGESHHNHFFLPIAVVQKVSLVSLSDKFNDWKNQCLYDVTSLLPKDIKGTHVIYIQWALVFVFLLFIYSVYVWEVGGKVHIWVVMPIFFTTMSLETRRGTGVCTIIIVKWIIALVITESTNRFKG